MGQHTYIAGAIVSIVATLASCYQFVSWTGDVGTVADVNDASTIIHMDDWYMITANFAKK